MVTNELVSTCHIAPGHRVHHMRIYHRFCYSLLDAGYKVSLIAHADESIDEKDGLQLMLLDSYAPNWKWRLKERWMRNSQAFRWALSCDADLFHFYSPEFIPWAVRLKRRTGKPVVFDCMEDFESYLWQRPNISGVLRPILAKALRHYLWRASLELDAITVADPGTARIFQGGKARVVPILNLPRLDLFPGLSQVGSAKFDLVYPGGLSRQRLEFVLAIDDALVLRQRPVSWYFLGIIHDLDWFIGEIRRRSAVERFTIGGYIPHDQVSHHMRRARIGIIPLPCWPKYLNNIPQKLFEYMALRMPVVLSDLPPSRPFVGDGKCAVMVNPDSPDEYADAIISLLDNPAVRARMGEEGRKRIESKYNWQIESGKLLNLYADLLA